VLIVGKNTHAALPRIV